MTAAARVHAADVTRAMIGFRKGGCEVGSVEIDASGTIIIKAAGIAKPAGRGSSLDRLFAPKADE